MNKKLKRMAIVGATVLMTASSVGFSNAMSVKNINPIQSTGKVYICVNGKKLNFNFTGMSILDSLKWFNHNNCPNKFPSIDNNESSDKDDNTTNGNQNNNNQQNNGNNQNGNIENNKPGNNNQNQGQTENKPGSGNDQNQGNNNNNQENNNNQGGNIENNNQNNNNSTNTSDFSKEQVEVLNLVNKERAAQGLKPLTLNKELSRVATLKSKDMNDKNYFDHTSPTYGSPFDMMKKFNISYNTAGENIAMGQKTPSEVMNSWMNSSGHRANILNSTYTELGVGIQKDSNGTIYWTQMFIGR